MKAKTKTVFLLRTRLNDGDPWGRPRAYLTRARRDKAASFARILGGIRTHSYEEKMPVDQAAELDYAQ